MKILLLSPRMDRYRWASYQQDVIVELARQTETTQYGPGCDGYDPADSLDDILEKCRLDPDWIVVGHAWLADGPNGPIDRHPCLGGSPVLPIAMILNKEYARLDEKLRWAVGVGVRVIFTHHHDAPCFERKSAIRTIHWPFAADPSRFAPAPSGRSIDLAFSGILQNMNGVGQSDLRALIMNELFECDGDVPVRLRDSYNGLDVFFNALPRDTVSRRAPAAGNYRRLSDEEYATMVGSARVLLNTRSPGDLVSPRVFEAMLSGTTVLAERNPAHDRLFPPGTIIEFDGVDGFRRMLPVAIERSRDHVMMDSLRAMALREHTWEARVASLIGTLSALTHPSRLEVGTP